MAVVKVTVDQNTAAARVLRALATVLDISGAGAPRPEPGAPRRVVTVRNHRPGLASDARVLRREAARAWRTEAGELVSSKHP